MNNGYICLFNSQDIEDEGTFHDIKANIAEANNIPMNKVSDDWVYDTFFDYINDIKQNLNIEIEGYIVAYCRVKLWSGNTVGYKTFGTNIQKIFNYCGCAEGEWYADRYNIRAFLLHHDGSNQLVFRYVESKEKLERVCNNIYNGKIRTEKDFFKATKSIRSFIAKVYGWKEYGKQVV